MRILRSLLAAASIAAAATAPTQAAPVKGAESVVSRTLDNGLQIIVWPDHDIPNVALYTFYRVGGRNEYPGITGIAHYFEHMMFNGTSTRAPGEFDRTMEAAGGFMVLGAGLVADALGLTPWLDENAGTLSSGTARKVWYLMCTVGEADLVVLDEPFNALDAEAVETVVGELHAWAERATVVLVSHLPPPGLAPTDRIELGGDRHAS